MTSSPPGVSATPQSALNVVRQASGVATGTAAGVSLALNGATLGPDSAYAELAAFGQTTLGAASNVDLLTQTVAANSAAIFQLQNQTTADIGNGVNFFVNFGADGATLDGFTPSYTGAGGTVEIVDGAAVLQPVGSGVVEVDELYTDTPTLGDEQLVSTVYATKPAGSANNILICRSNADGSTMVYAAVNASGAISLYNVVSGTATRLALATPGPFATGATYSISAGFDGDTPVFEVIISGVGRLIFNDDALVTNSGADYRYCGFGLRQTVGAPSQVASFGFVDDGPAPLIGDLFYAHAVGETPTSFANNPACVIAPPNFYSGVVAQTSNYAYDPSTNKLTVTVPGVYLVKVSAEWSPGASSSYGMFGVGVVKNDIVYDFDETYSPAGMPFSLTTSGLFLMDMLKGDWIQPCLITYSNAPNEDVVIVGVNSRFFCALFNTGIAASTG